MVIHAALLLLGLVGAGTARSDEQSEDPDAAARAVLRAGEWYEAASSHMVDVCPPAGRPACGAVMGAWSGGAYDTKRDRLLIWGGGHVDYWGNEVYGFDVRSLTWVRLNEPYFPAAFMTAGDTVSVYPDGSPASRHTYDGIEYLPSQDRLWVNGGSRWKSGTGDAYTGWFDQDALAWEPRSDSPVPVLAGASAYDPVRDRVYQYTRRGLLEYDPGADRWEWRAHDAGPISLVAEVDPVNRKLVLVGQGRAYVYTLQDEGRLQRQPLNAVGDVEIESARAPGLAYHPPTGRIVAWAGGADVYALDLASTPPRWERIAPAPENGPVPSPGTRNGVYGRWRYVPGFDVFIGVTSVHENVYFYRMP